MAICDGYEVEVTDDAVTIRSTDGPMTARLLATATAEVAEHFRGVEQRRWEGFEQGLREDLRAAWYGEQLAPGGPARITDTYLATLAYVYEQVPSYLPPVRTLAAMLDRSPDTIKMHCMKARDRGLLSHGEAGRGVGTMTEKARQILAC